MSVSVLLIFRWHALHVIFYTKIFIFVVHLDLQQLPDMEWKRMKSTTFPVIELSDNGQQKSFSIIFYDPSKKKKKKKEGTFRPQDFIIQHRHHGLRRCWRSFLERSPPEVELHTVLILWSPKCWGTRLLSTFQPTCHRAGICCSKYTSNTSKLDPCIYAVRRLHHLHSAGRSFHLVHDLCARNTTLWRDEDDLIWRRKWKEAKNRV